MHLQQLMFNTPVVLSITGHRPDKLGGYGETAFANLISFARTKLQDIKPIEVFTGMALGWDQAVALACIDLDIPFNACMVKGQSSIWNSHLRARFDAILERAKVKTIHGDANTQGYMKRNFYMVDNSNSTLCLYNGDSTGGTAATVKYARARGKTIVNCWDDWTKYIQ